MTTRFLLRSLFVCVSGLAGLAACSSSDTGSPAGGSGGDGAGASSSGGTSAGGSSSVGGSGVAGSSAGGAVGATGGAPGAGGTSAFGQGGASVGGSATTGGAAGTTSAGGTTSASEPPPLTGITAAHNAARAAVVPAANPPIPPLTWSMGVAATAQAWADNCTFKHSQGKYGENIYATSGTATPQDVVSSWVGEAANYDYATNSCSKVCGHYTQVVWRDSVSLGCGATTCTKNSPFGGGSWQFWVCNYDPPGNYNGQKPY